jgi:hypothetical protein
VHLLLGLQHQLGQIQLILSYLVQLKHQLKPTQRLLRQLLQLILR